MFAFSRSLMDNIQETEQQQGLENGVSVQKTKLDIVAEKKPLEEKSESVEQQVIDKKEYNDGEENGKTDYIEKEEAESVPLVNNINDDKEETESSVPKTEINQSESAVNGNINDENELVNSGSIVPTPQRATTPLKENVGEINGDDLTVNGANVINGSSVPSSKRDVQELDQDNDNDETKKKIKFNDEEKNGEVSSTARNNNDEAVQV
ncbi:unnamed protein product [Didymodactylos carnosus]|uniref:Uncharacterized protein n=2 Tax=Didymodactylos carnosus TaxID=1234261 RepID=A0A8S2GGW4_9BILA|nr:unnamed protein product [Didymodactylos carnosus]CAF3512835.1 unnamed protein product [Didymodactylos carnosus]